MPSRYQPGDIPGKTRDLVRVHLPSCIPQRGECGCSLELFPQPWRFYLKRGGTQINVSERDYDDSLAEYRRQRDRGLAP